MANLLDLWRLRTELNPRPFPLTQNERFVLGDLGVEIRDLSAMIGVAEAYERVRAALDRPAQRPDDPLLLRPFAEIILPVRWPATAGD